MNKILCAFLIIIIPIVGLVLIQWHYFDFEEFFWESLVVSLLGGLIVLLPLLFVIETLLKKHEKEVENEMEVNEYLKMFNKRNQKLVKKLENHFLALIQKKTILTQTTKEGDLDQVLNNINDIVNEDFPGTDNILKFDGGSEEPISYQKYFLEIFAPGVRRSINGHTSSFTNYIPTKISNSLIILEDALDEQELLAMYLSSGEKANTTNNIDKLRSNLLKIGEEIQFLKEYLESAPRENG